MAGKSSAHVCKRRKRLRAHSGSFLSHHLFITKCSSASVSLVWGNCFAAPSNHLSNARFLLRDGKELEVGAAPCTKCSDLPGRTFSGGEGPSLSPCAGPSEHNLHKCPRRTSPTNPYLHHCPCQMACCPLGWDCALAWATRLCG